MLQPASRGGVKQLQKEVGAAPLGPSWEKRMDAFSWLRARCTSSSATL